MTNCLAIFCCLLLINMTFSEITVSKFYKFKEQSNKLSNTITSLTQKSLKTEVESNVVPTYDNFNNNCETLLYAYSSYDNPTRMWYYKKKMSFSYHTHSRTYVEAAKREFVVAYELMELNIDFSFVYFYYQSGSASVFTQASYALYFDDILIEEFLNGNDCHNCQHKYESITLSGSVYRVCPGKHTVSIRMLNIRDVCTYADSNTDPSYITLTGWIR